MKAQSGLLFLNEDFSLSAETIDSRKDRQAVSVTRVLGTV